MPICGGCKTFCNCVLSEDGVYSGHTELGRNFSTIEGTGTSEDPFVIHFLDQQEFRPRTAEFTFDVNPNIASGLYLAPGGNTTATYQSPLNFLVKSDFSGNYKYAQINNYLVGASATFTETADATSNVRELVLVANNSAGPNLQIFAGQTTPGGSADPLTLSCAAVIGGAFVPQIWPFQQFVIYVFQDSGSPLVVTNIKVWVTQI